MSSWPCRISLTLMLAATLLSLGSMAWAQQLEWHAFDASPPGTPARVVFDANGSDANASFFDVFIHGFYYQTRMSPRGEPFTEIVFPGLSPFSQPGQPFLPAVQVSLAFPPGASIATLDQVEVMSSNSMLPPSPVWPTTIMEQDHPGTPERFVPPDPTIYQSPLPWPSGNGDGRQQASHKGPVMGASFKLFPVHWNPSTNSLAVMTHVRYKISHPGVPTPAQPVTKDASKYAAKAFINWLKIATYYPPNGATWTGDYLIVAQSTHGFALLPLITQKAARGYAVTVHFLTVGEMGNAFAIRNAIATWYSSTPSWHDHYALLVGDVGAIPFGAVSGVPTDDLYADADGDGNDDLDQEVYVGRLSANDAADVDNQVTKWLKYEDSPATVFDYGKDLLIGNLQDAPGKYVGCLESVANYGAYTTTPNFTKVYGSLPGNTNAVISSNVNAGFGIVTYRGHGDWDQWWNWNTLGESYFSSHVDALTDSIAPVVWSIACTTFDCTAEDCFGEHWMAAPDPHGAVSFYGATEASDTEPNHVLTRALHRAVFQWGFTKQGRAIEFSEATMYDTTGSWNSWRYGLLGDPDMDVRRETNFPFTVVTPPSLPLSLDIPVPIQVLDGQHRPIANALVGAYKPSGPGAAAHTIDTGFTTAAAEFFDNHYTDANGNVTLNGSTATSGWLYYSVRLDEGPGQGAALLDSIPVSSLTGVPHAGPGVIGLRAVPNITQGVTEFRLGQPLNRDARILVSDVTGRIVRSLELGRGMSGVRWDGRRGSGTDVPNGIYFARLSDEGTAFVARVTILR